MRVLLWSELFWPYIGGAEVFGARLSLALRNRGHDVQVVTSHDYLDLPDEARCDGIPVHRLPFRAALAGHGLGRLRDLRERVSALKRDFAPDLVHVNALGPSLAFHLQTAAVHPLPWLLTLQGELLPSQAVLPDTLTGRAVLLTDWVVGCSAAVLRQARQLAPAIRTRSSVIRNSIESPAVRPGPPSRERPRLVCLGRLVPAKGFDVAVTAFATLAPRFPALRLVVAGDGPARASLERQVAELGLRDAVDFLGWVAPDQVPALLNAATVVVMPSRREGLPLAAVQAALMARPIVASRVGGLPEVVAHQRTGLLVDPDDNRAFADAIAFLLQHPDAAARMGRAGRRRARASLSWDRCVDAYDALYRRLGRGQPC